MGQFLEQHFRFVWLQSSQNTFSSLCSMLKMLLPAVALGQGSQCPPPCRGHHQASPGVTPACRPSAHTLLTPRGSEALQADCPPPHSQNATKPDKTSRAHVLLPVTDCGLGQAGPARSPPLSSLPQSLQVQTPRCHRLLGLTLGLVYMAKHGWPSRWSMCPRALIAVSLELPAVLLPLPPADSSALRAGLLQGSPSQGTRAALLSPDASPDSAVTAHM